MRYPRLMGLPNLGSSTRRRRGSAALPQLETNRTDMNRASAWEGGVPPAPQSGPTWPPSRRPRLCRRLRRGKSGALARREGLKSALPNDCSCKKHQIPVETDKKWVGCRVLTPGRNMSRIDQPQAQSLPRNARRLPAANGRRAFSLALLMLGVVSLEFWAVA